MKIMNDTRSWFDIADDAMARAALRAREIAKITNTSLHIMRDGRIIEILPNGEEIMCQESPKLEQFAKSDVS